MADGLRIGEEPLTPERLVATARGGPVRVELVPAARERMAASHRAVEAAAKVRRVYGWTTGVGANRHVEIEPGQARAHSLRLLRSHAAGIGEPLPDELVRGTIVVRLAQMAAAGGGQRPAVADALVAVLRDGRLPVLHNLGGIGTGDLSLLAQLALALAGEGEWGHEREAGPAPAADARLEIQAGDALAFMSSNAVTFASAALAWADACELLDAGLGIAALTFRALDGNAEAFAAPIGAARPLPGLIAANERLRVLTAGAPEPARLQDPFGLRCLPQVAGALHGALARLHDLLATEINAAAENPLIAGADVLHHGGFHAAECALALDALRLALVPFAGLSAARLSHLTSPLLSDLPPFLSGDAPGSSGVLIAEYLATDALARLRAEAAPAVLGSAVISRGLEEHASFAWQGAGQARHALAHLRTVLGLEWVVAERALRMKEVPAAGPLAPARRLAAGFEESLEDRPIGADAELAVGALPALARVVRDAMP